MTKIKFLFTILSLMMTLSFCNAQSSNKLNLSKIIFHLSRCNGTCPKIDLEIDSAKNVYVSREYFKSKSETDKTYSGQFKGNLSQKDYNKLLKLLQSSNIDTLTFPSTTMVDVSETTIIVYYNEKRKYLKSSETPAIAKNLIIFLKSVGNNKKLKRTKETKTIEI
jgi:Domain of unknown function (DUF6438)